VNSGVAVTCGTSRRLINVYLYFSKFSANAKTVREFYVWFYKDGPRLALADPSWRLLYIALYEGVLSGGDQCADRLAANNLF
jgi:hypothetical protein